MSAPLFEKVLIANRGEIALRVIKTLKKMGIKTVAVYSEADTNALHVHQADEAIYIGPSPATESYLSIPNLIEAVRKSGAQAVHPGYGFLSENAGFARALKKEGVVLIGPSASVIKTMGDKIEAKKLAKESGVSTIPGYSGVVESESHALEIAKDIGFPIIIKAAAGGGGRGMRVIERAEDVANAYISATREAKNSFSDGRIFIEKFIQKPRHIEIQVLADQFGNVVCLGERECSIQRHHQKVVEEAPSSFVDDATRKKMYDQVISLAHMVKYYSAGTVEFMMDDKKNFYFLEMNTRLQVEHCVTELITGIDIVEQMVKIAAKQKLEFTQEDIRLSGWAIESRIYSEDPTRGFLPSSGRIAEYSEPNSSPNIRIDSGVKEGYEVSMFYDPMIAKLCSYAQTRTEAIEHMRDALSNYVINGISHNISFLEAIMANENFALGNIHTSFIDQEYPGGFLGAELTSEITQIFLSVGIFIYMAEIKRNAIISGQLEGRAQIGTRWVVTIDDNMYPIFIKQTDQGYTIRHERNRLFVKSNWILGNNLFRGVVNDKTVSVRIEKFDGGYYLTHAGAKATVKVRTPRIAELEKFMIAKPEYIDQNEIVANITGKIVSIKVAEGDEIKAGEELVIIEAMKMENSICSEHGGLKVTKIHVKAGDNISSGQTILELA
jgi:propionyl-CoA carboxylase alpha chain